MSNLLEFFYDGRKILISLVTFIIFLISFFVFEKEIIPYSIYISVFSRYFGEFRPLAFLIFYYFVVACVYSTLFVTLYDMITIVMRGDKSNV